MPERWQLHGLVEGVDTSGRDGCVRVQLLSRLGGRHLCKQCGRVCIVAMSERRRVQRQDCDVFVHVRSWVSRRQMRGGRGRVCVLAVSARRQLHGVEQLVQSVDRCGHICVQLLDRLGRRELCHGQSRVRVTAVHEWWQLYRFVDELDSGAGRVCVRVLGRMERHGVRDAGG